MPVQLDMPYRKAMIALEFILEAKRVQAHFFMPLRSLPQTF
jgi:hypothetical protein